MTARELIERLPVAGTLEVDAIPAGQDLKDAGLESADLVQLGMELEDHLETRLGADELDALTTIEQIDALLAARAGDANGNGNGNGSPA